MMPLVLAAAAASACSVNHPVSGATVPSPIVAQVAGTWTGPVSLQGVSALASGLDCVDPAVAAFVGSSEASSLVISQTAADLTAQVVSPSNGVLCNYSGAAGAANMVLNTSACTAPVLVVQCATGEVHSLQLNAALITATVSDGVATGTLLSTFNVVDSGAPGTPAVSSTASFKLVKQ